VISLEFDFVSSLLKEKFNEDMGMEVTRRSRRVVNRKLKQKACFYVFW
jgi:hypothetical protein